MSKLKKDSDEDIQKCLNCKLKECNNCIERERSNGTGHRYKFWKDVVIEYLNSNVTYAELAKKYNIQRATISMWVRQYKNNECKSG